MISRYATSLVVVDFGVPLNLMVSAHGMVREDVEIWEEQRIRLRLGTWLTV